jgi:hypothetical protein
MAGRSTRDIRSKRVGDKLVDKLLRLRAGEYCWLVGWRKFGQRFLIESRMLGYDTRRHFVEVIARDKRSGAKLTIYSENQVALS